MTDIRTELVQHLDTTLRTSGRRDFLRLAAAGGIGVFLPTTMTACAESVSPDPYTHAAFTMSAPVGPLNLIYAYTQFMYDFYFRFTQENTQFLDETKFEHQIFNTLFEQKGALGKSLRILIPKGRIVDALLFDFTTVTFTERASVMTAAQTFEDLGITMINGLAPVFTNPTDLLLASKISSVWSRHAAVVRDMIYVSGAVPSRAHFAGDDVVDPTTGFDPAKDPAAFAAAAQPYFITELAIR